MCVMLVYFNALKVVLMSLDLIHNAHVTLAIHLAVMGLAVKVREMLHGQINNQSLLLDINECAVSSLCSHGCHNTNGSFHCSCPGGFFLASDRRNCIGEDYRINIIYIVIF